MDNTARFSDRVSDYVKFRPGYPDDLFSFLFSRFKLQPGSVVADIGSGTGISSECFLKNDVQVFGVEPNSEMRSAAEQFLSGYPGFYSVSGTAEKTSLKDQSIDLVFCAQAFHWFDPGVAINEFKRIRKPGSFVCLVWNDRNTSDSEFSETYEAFLQKHSIDYKKVNHKNFSREKLTQIIPFPLSEEQFSNSQELDYEGLLGRVLSSSYMPSREHERFRNMEAELNSLFHRHNFGGKVKITYTTRLFYFTV